MSATQACQAVLREAGLPPRAPNPPLPHAAGAADLSLQADALLAGLVVPGHVRCRSCLVPRSPPPQPPTPTHSPTPPHPTPCSAIRAEVVDFLRWALAQPNTWALTYTQYVAWLEAGPAADVSTGCCLPACRPPCRRAAGVSRRPACGAAGRGEGGSACGVIWCKVPAGRPSQPRGWLWATGCYA